MSTSPGGPPNSVRVSPRYIGILGEDDPIQPGTIAFIFCLVLIFGGFVGLMMIYVKNHRARIKEFEIELRKRQVLRERERSIMMTEAENERAMKRRLLEEQDIALRYRHVQGHGVYEDSSSLSPMSPGNASPFSYSGYDSRSAPTRHQGFNDFNIEMEAADVPPPHQQQHHQDSYTAYHHDDGGAILQAQRDGRDASSGVRLFDHEDSYSLPRRPTNPAAYY
jgi:hypothetical protein